MMWRMSPYSGDVHRRVIGRAREHALACPCPRPSFFRCAPPCCSRREGADGGARRGSGEGFRRVVEARPWKERAKERAKKRAKKREKKGVERARPSPRPRLLWTARLRSRENMGRRWEGAGRRASGILSELNKRRSGVKGSRDVSGLRSPIQVGRGQWGLASRPEERRSDAGGSRVDARARRPSPDEQMSLYNCAPLQSRKTRPQQLLLLLLLLLPG